MHRLLATLALSGFVPTAPTAGAPYIAVALITDTSTPRPGTSFVLGLRMTPRPGWHGYWSNPGDSGLAPNVKWSGPAGVHFGSLRHPAPELLKVAGITSYVHAGPHVLTTRVAIDRGMAPGTAIPINADLTFAACSDKLCVPRHMILSMRLVAGSAAASPDSLVLHRAVESQPRTVADGVYGIDHGKLLLTLPTAARLSVQNLHFFPDGNGFFDPAEARVASAAPLRILSPILGQPPRIFSGVASDGRRSYRLRFVHDQMTQSKMNAAGPAPRPESIADVPPSLISGSSSAARPSGIYGIRLASNKAIPAASNAKQRRTFAVALIAFLLLVATSLVIYFHRRGS